MVGMGLATIGTGIAAFYFDQQMEQSRNEENTATTVSQTNAAHNNYINAQNGRDISRNIAIGTGATAVAFGIVFVININ